MSPEIQAAFAVLFRHPVVCDSCKTVKGWALVTEKCLLLPTGDMIRFPYWIRCFCGKNVRWSKAVRQLPLDTTTAEKDNPQQ